MSEGRGGPGSILELTSDAQCSHHQSGDRGDLELRSLEIFYQNVCSLLSKVEEFELN